MAEDRVTTDAPGAQASILVVDDERDTRELLRRLLVRFGYRVDTAEDGDAALAAIERGAPDLVLLDVRMPPGIDGFQVCRRIKQNPATRLLPVILMTGVSAHDHRLRGIDAGADEFLAKPFDSQELGARVRSLINLKRYTDDLDSAESIILSLALTVEARDAYTDGHCLRLSRYAVALGTMLGLRDDELAALLRGGYLHDVGKIGIPDHVLLKPGPLTPAEYELMKGHTVIGERLCGELRSLRLVRSIVRHHHEKLDGSGYPDGLRGDEIPLLAQIVGIADAYDAMTTDRPYRVARSRAEAFEELAAEASCSVRRSDLVDAFIRLGATGELDRLACDVEPVDQGRLR